MSGLIANPNAMLPVRRTKLAGAVLEHLERDRRGVTTPYQIFMTICGLHTPDNRRRLYIHSETAAVDDLQRVTTNLLKTQGILPDHDYGRGVYRVPSVGDIPAEDACALVNPFGYVSHLSAMQRWGLTVRRPEALYLSMPAAKAARQLIEERMAADYGAPFEALPQYQAVKLRFIRHPETVRKRSVFVHESRRPGKWIQIRDSYTRLATVGQTFVDTLEWPRYCGGMAHVLEIWREHAPTYLEDIISAVDNTTEPIVKVRAGYLIDDMLGQGKDPRIQGWLKLVQRGGSRVLDPARDFSAQYSEKWMLSINA